MSTNKGVCLSYGGNPVNITRRRKNSDINERVNRSIDIINDISMSRPDWSITPGVNENRESKLKPLDRMLCSICVTDIEENQGRYTTRCGHSYHLECILPWFARKTSCPICRENDIKNPISLNNEN